MTLTRPEQRKIRKLRKQGLSYVKIAKKLDRSVPTVRKYCLLLDTSFDMQEKEEQAVIKQQIADLSVLASAIRTREVFDKEIEKIETNIGQLSIKIADVDQALKLLKEETASDFKKLAGEVSSINTSIIDRLENARNTLEDTVSITAFEMAQTELKKLIEAKADINQIRQLTQQIKEIQSKVGRLNESLEGIQKVVEGIVELFVGSRPAMSEVSIKEYMKKWLAENR